MSSPSINLSTPGLALYSLPAAWVVAFYPNYMRAQSMKKLRGYSNVKPRENAELLKDSSETLDETTRNRLARMIGAHQNGMENLPIWFAAVLAGHVAGLPHRTMNMFAGGYLALRLLYNYIYFNQRTEAEARYRTLVYFAGLGFPITLMIKAANKLRAAAF
ncbi:MAPEG family protein [Phanerochaete sordida]|uniref:MAPEG family protein n=1 Tax=Phanerochaete sordida TaxID=48140 RepID=A0A9P3FY40_9APHY|nr:MAPEG family protein [Phanerochaete sordida]